MEMEDAHILLFDGVCHLCNRLVPFVIRRDPKAKFRFAALQSVPGQQLLRQFGQSMDHLDTFIYIRAGKCLRKSTAALEILKEIGGGWKLLYILKIIPLFLRDWVYDRIARSRYRIFGREAACMVPEPEFRKRFLDEDTVFSSGKDQGGN